MFNETSPKVVMSNNVHNRHIKITLKPGWGITGAKGAFKFHLWNSLNECLDFQSKNIQKFFEVGDIYVLVALFLWLYYYTCMVTWIFTKNIKTREYVKKHTDTHFIGQYWASCSSSEEINVGPRNVIPRKINDLTVDVK